MLVDRQQNNIDLKVKSRALAGWARLGGLGVVAALLLGFAMPTGLLAQEEENWRVYRASDGLSDSYTTAVTVGPKGSVWATHRQIGAISALDGYEVRQVSTGGGIYFPVRVTRTGQIWSVYSGGLQEFKDGEWIQYPIPEIRTENQVNLLRRVRPISIVPYQHNRLLFLLGDRLTKFDAFLKETDVVKYASETRLGRFWDMIGSRKGGLWITGERGVARMKGPLRKLPEQARWKEFLLPKRLGVENLQRPLVDGEGGITMIAESTEGSERMVVHFDGSSWKTYDVAGKNVRKAWRQSDGTIWGITINSLFRLRSGDIEVLEREGLLAGQYFDAAVQEKDVFWLATSEGLVRYAPLPWQTPKPMTGDGVPFHTIRQDERGTIWFGTAVGLVRQEDGEWTHYEWPIEEEVFFQATDRMVRLPSGHYVVDLNRRLYRFDPERGRFASIDIPRAQAGRVLGQVNDGSKAVVATRSLTSSNGAADIRLFDGESWSDFPDPQREGPERGSWLFFEETSEGDYWLGGTEGIARYRDGDWTAFKLGDGRGTQAALCMLERRNGEIWFGGRGGVWAFNGKGLKVVRRGLDRVNKMVQVKDDTIWMAASSGLYRYRNGSWLRNGVEEGLPSAAVYEIFEGEGGTKWAGTSRGVSRYHPAADPDPPETEIELSKKRVKSSPQRGINVPFQGRDKWKFTSDERLLYSFRVDQGGWSSLMRKTEVTLTNLAAGPHRFQVRAVDRNGNLDPSPAKAELMVTLPWHQDPRLVAISIGGAIIILLLAALAYNRHRRLVRSYAEVERIVEQRTRELERANQQLLHSQKMKALGTLAAGIAHDFNSMLSIVKGSVQIIDRNLDDPQKIKGRTTRIKTVVEQGTSLVKAMLGFSRDPRREATQFDLNQVLDEAIKLVEDRWSDRVEIKLYPGSNLPKLHGVPELLKQIVVNLLINASEAMGEEGTIAVESGLAEGIPDELVISPATCGDYAFVAVRDSGQGIDPEDQHRIFEPFFTTKSFSSKRGTGLGLSMVYEFARTIGVGIRVDSVTGQGTQFTLYIPLGSSESEAELASAGHVRLNG